MNPEELRRLAQLMREQGYADEAIVAELRKRAAPKPEPSLGDKILAGAAGFSQGATFGLGDEINGASEYLNPMRVADRVTGRATTTAADDYRAARDEARAVNKELENDSPGAYLTGQVVGAAPAVVAGGAGVLKLGRAVAPAAARLAAANPKTAGAVTALPDAASKLRKGDYLGAAKTIGYGVVAGGAAPKLGANPLVGGLLSQLLGLGGGGAGGIAAGPSGPEPLMAGQGQPRPDRILIEKVRRAVQSGELSQEDALQILNSATDSVRAQTDSMRRGLLAPPPMSSPQGLMQRPDSNRTVGLLGL